LSTKIHNGYLLPLMTLVELNHFMEPVRERFMPLVVAGITKWTADFSANVIDFHSLGRVPPLSLMGRAALTEKGSVTTRPIADAYVSFFERNMAVQEKRKRDPEVDWTCSWTFIPHRGVLLCLLFTERVELMEAWKKVHLVKDWHYQNSTDRPDEVSEEEWDRRAKDWHDALGRKVPAEVGFSTDLFSTYSTPHATPEMVIKAVPDYSTRLSNMARNIVASEHLRDMGEISPEKYGPAIMQVFEWVDGEEGLEAVEATKDKISGKLKKVITVHDLQSELTFKSADQE
jgi:hypothetical protein